MQVTKLENNKEDVHMRVAAYCRVSTDKDAQAESLENQMEAFRYRLALHKNWDLVKIYADEGLSGTSGKNRARFQEMLDDCRAGRIDYIITKSISRFARKAEDVKTISVRKAPVPSSFCLIHPKYKAAQTIVPIASIPMSNRDGSSLAKSSASEKATQLMAKQNSPTAIVKPNPIHILAFFHF